jgi:hypothetical protein
MKNHAAAMSIRNLEKLGLAVEAPMQMKSQLIPMSQVKSMLKQNGVDVSAVSNDVFKGIRKMWGIQKPSDPNVVRVMVDGKAKYYTVEDRLLHESLTSINGDQFGSWMTLLSAPKRWLTTGVTITPGFQVANFTRDTLHAFVISRDEITPVISGLKGAKKALSKSDEYWRMLAAGGGFQNGYINAHDPASTAKVMKAEMRKKGFKDSVVDSPKRAFDRWLDFTNGIENANRIAVFNAALDKKKGALAAAYEGKDFMDFSMTGNGTFYRFLSQTVPFFNARVQGLYRLGRGAYENPRAFLLKGSMVVAASVAYALLNGDDERYKDLSEEDKDLYWHFWTSADSDAVHIRVPKPFEVGFIFGTVPERMIEAAMSDEDDNTKRFLKRIGWNIASTLELNPTPQAVKPMVELWADRDTFTGRPIVGMAGENKIPEAQYSPFTHESMIALGKEFGISPAKAEHLIQGYFGPVGDWMLGAADVITRGLGEYPAKPEMKLDDYPVIGRFIKNAEPRHSRYSQEFWDLFEKARQVHNTVNAYRKEGDIQAAKAIVGEKRDELIDYNIGNMAYSSVKLINAQIKAVHQSKKLSPAEKRERLDKLTRKKLEIYKRSVQKMKQ